jgi:hypothetical protein
MIVQEANCPENRGRVMTTSVTLTVAERQHYAEDFLAAILPAVAADAVDAFLELLQLLDTQSERPE